MAYRTKAGTLCPNLAGEFCGNHMPESWPVAMFGETPQEAEAHQRRYLAQMLSGKPSTCPAGTSEEMAAKGYVGLYLKNDVPIPPDGILVETDELTEGIVSTRGTDPLDAAIEATDGEIDLVES